MSVDIDDFKVELECDYKNEHYTVRDNGAIMRHCKEGQPYRKSDGCWVFGKPNSKNYLCFSSESVHRIVATAFHGVAPTPQHIVDHIDTNRHNNRPENLRWLTKLENILNNPNTKSKIIYLCGSIEAFLADPSILPANDGDPNFGWMRRVTKEEGQNCLERMNIWAEKQLDLDVRAHLSSNEDDTYEVESSSQRAWVFNRMSTRRRYTKSLSFLPATHPQLPTYKKSLTLNAVQENWNTPTEFSLCPQEDSDNPINEYFSRLKVGAVFTQNEYGESTIAKFAMAQDSKSILVLCNIRSTIKPRALTEVRFEDGLYIHTSLGSFFSEDGAEKGFTLACGLDWTGEDSIDDFC